MSDVLARAAEVLGAHQPVLADDGEYLWCECGNTKANVIAQHAEHQAQMLADEGLLAESAPVADGNRAVSGETCPARPTTHETDDSGSEGAQ